VNREEAIGSAVKLRFWKAVARMGALSGLPESVASWSFAAFCAPALSVLM
jgi:hypothetical protein